MFEKATRGMSIYAKIAYVFLVAMGVCIPLAAGSEYYPVSATVSQFGLYKMCAFFLLLGATALFYALDYVFGNQEVRWHSIMWWALGYGAVSLISYVFAIDKRVSLFGDYDRFLGLIPTFLTILLLFLAIQLIRNSSAMRIFMQVFVVVSVFLAGYGIAQAFGVEIAHFSNMETLGHRSFSLFGNPNMYAGYLCFSVFFSAGLLATEKTRSWKIFYWVALLANLATTLTSMTRSIWLACAVVGPLFIIFMVRQKAEFAKADKVVAGISAASGVGYILFTLTRKSADLNIGTRLASMFSSDGSSSTRIEIWKTASRVIKEHPLFGTGPDSFGVSSSSQLTQKYISIMGMDGMTDNAHSLPLQLASTVGILGMLSFYAIFVYVCIIGLKYAWDNHEQKQRHARLFYASVLCAILAYSIHALVSVAPMDVLPFYWICFGFLVAPKSHTVELNVPAFSVGSLAMAATVFIGSVIFTGCFLGADHACRLAQDMQQGSSAQVQEYAKATRLNPFEVDYETEYLDALGGNYILRLKSLSAADASSLIAALNRSYAKYPYRVDLGSVVSYYYTAMALTYQTQDLLAGAIKTNDEILEKTPYDISTMGNQGAIYRTLGEVNKAEVLRNKIVSTGPNSKKKEEALNLMDSVKLVESK